MRQSLVLKDASFSFGMTSHLLTIESVTGKPFLSKTPKTIHLVNKITNVLQITFSADPSSSPPDHPYQDLSQIRVKLKQKEHVVSWLKPVNRVINGEG